MQGLFYLLGNLAICVVILWALMNDHVTLTGPTSGLLAMPSPPTDKTRAPHGAGILLSKGGDGPRFYS